MNPYNFYRIDPNLRFILDLCFSLIWDGWHRKNLRPSFVTIINVLTYSKSTLMWHAICIPTDYCLVVFKWHRSLHFITLHYTVHFTFLYVSCMTNNCMFKTMLKIVSSTIKHQISPNVNWIFRILGYICVYIYICVY